MMENERTILEEMIALRQVEPPYEWEGWSETLDDIDALTTTPEEGES